jgi:hypothetical protein
VTKEKTQRLIPKIKIGILDESASISDDAITVTAGERQTGISRQLVEIDTDLIFVRSDSPREKRIVVASESR